MKLASKWIVIPYNSHVNKTENSLTSKEKIEKIVNNKNIVDIDKLNLINQIINKNITPPQIIAEHKKEETYPNFQFINDHIQTNENIQENNIEKETVLVFNSFILWYIFDLGNKTTITLLFHQ